MKLTTFLAALFASALSLPAAITNITETNLGADTPAIIATGFAEDVNTFSDRVHQHNGVAFEADILNTTGTTIVGLPDYLIGNDYILFANDARENTDYSATVETDVLSIFYVLIDNRIDGPAGTTGSLNTTDPVLGGTLQWVIDGGWERVNTGISPAGQADYTGVDEGGESAGAGIGVNQFYSVYRLPTAAIGATVSNNGVGGSNMVALVAAPAPDPEDPISAFSALPTTISEGESANLSWVIHPDATVGTIDSGIGDILPSTNAGFGTIPISPAVTSTYTLSVESPDGNETAEATINVRLIGNFTADFFLIDSGDPLNISWQTRDDAALTLSGTGSVSADSSIMLNPTEDTTYTLTAVAGDESETAEIRVRVAPAGELYALLDLGATDGTAETGALTGAQIGAAAAGTNATNLALTNLTSETGDDFTIAIDNIDMDGAAVGNLDWRDRGTASGAKWTALGEDHFKNNGGVIRVTLGGLPAGEYQMTSWHFDATFSQGENIQILVTDANGTAVDTGELGSAFADPTFTAEENTTANMDSHASLFSIESNGVDDVIIYFDGRGGNDTEIPLNGLRIRSSGAPDPPRIVSIVLDETAKTATLEFTSELGGEYSVFSSSDLKDFGNEEADSLPGEDETTTYIVTGVDTAVLLREFYLVRRTK